MKKIKNIIFDLGGVLFPINNDETKNRFQNNGLQNVNHCYMSLVESELFMLFETGKISPQDFRNGFNSMFGLDIDSRTFDECWNAMIISYPEANNPFLKKLKNDGYKLFVLSNTNQIHVEYLEPMANWREGLFDKIYYSNEIHLRKPNLECYEWVLADAGIAPEETVFIDDRLENIEVAQSAGIDAIRLSNHENLYETLDNYLK